MDGNLNPYGKCSRTYDDNNPSWWRVDLGTNNVPVFEVHIVNRFSSCDCVKEGSKDYQIAVGECTFEINCLHLQNEMM